MKIKLILVILVLLISCKPEPNLFELIELEDYAAIKEHIDSDSEADINITNENGETAVIIAINKKDHKLLELLVDNGADIKSGDLIAYSLEKEMYRSAAILYLNGAEYNGMDFLNYAVSNNLNELAKTLIKSGVSTNIKDEVGRDIVEIALENKNSDLLNYLNLRLAVWIINDEINTIMYNLEPEDPNAGGPLNPDTKDDFGWTMLMYAAVNDSLEIGRLLIESGANPNIVNSNGKKAIDYAKSNSFKSLLRAKKPKKAPKDLLVGIWHNVNMWGNNIELNEDKTFFYQGSSEKMGKGSYSVSGKTVTLNNNYTYEDRYTEEQVVAKYKETFTIDYIDQDRLDITWGGKYSYSESLKRQ